MKKTAYQNDGNGNVIEVEIETNEPICIDKLIIVDRLIAFGKLPDALTALNSDTTKKARWDAATQIAVDDTDVIAVLTAIGVEPNTVLY